MSPDTRICWYIYINIYIYIYIIYIFFTVSFCSIIFFTAKTSVSKINFDGNDIVELKSDQSAWIRGIGVDLDNKRICWTNLGKILSDVDKTGGGIKSGHVALCGFKLASNFWMPGVDIVMSGIEG